MIPWDDWIKTAYGKMQMKPDDFWELSLREWTLTIRGFEEFHCSDGSQKGMDPNRLEELLESVGQ